MVLFPINEDDSHWILLVANLLDKKYYIYDSLHGRKSVDIDLDGAGETTISGNHATVARNVHGMLKAVDKELGNNSHLGMTGWYGIVKDMVHSPFFKNTRTAERVKCKQQTDGSSCGLFTILNAERVVKSADVTQGIGSRKKARYNLARRIYSKLKQEYEH